MNTIIFHHPLPLNFTATSASGIRPCKLYETFINMGFDVILIDGYSKERKEKIKRIITEIKKGLIVDFCYSESSTMPTALTDIDHIPRHPFIDSMFFQFLKKHDIPVKLFYRDIYWKFSSYNKQIGFPKNLFAKFFYLFDLFVYKGSITTIFIPSFGMIKYLPELKKNHTEELPSGTTIMFNEDTTVSSKLSLLYIGGIGFHYDLVELFNSVKNFPEIEMTICVRKNEWEMVADQYPIANNINIVHKSGEDLKDLYKKANIALLFINTSEYRNFAVPYKLFEYLSFGKPIIATSNTWVGNYVKEKNIGWDIDYSGNSFCTLLNKLKENPQFIKEKTHNARITAISNTWECRCQQIEGK